MSTDKHNNEELPLEQIAPTLAGLRSQMEEPNAPAEYFATLPDIINQRVKQLPEPAHYSIPKHRNRFSLAIAASLILFIGFALSIYVAQHRLENLQTGQTKTDVHDYYLDEVEVEHIIEVATELETTVPEAETGIEQYVDEYHLLEEL